MKVMAIIPVRYGSTRFPGKPLALLGDKPLVQWVYEGVKAEIDDVVVACDDQRISDAVHAFGGKAVMTSSNHTSGTSRVCEAYSLLGRDCDVVVNVQGDEPFINASHLLPLIQCFADDPHTDIATLVTPFNPGQEPFDCLSDPNRVKVVTDSSSRALYFSRSVIPYVRDIDPRLWPSAARYLMHVGVYAFRGDLLPQIAREEATPLSKAESLEQLSWLQHGHSITVREVDVPTIGIDTPADLEAARSRIAI